MHESLKQSWRSQALIDKHRFFSFTVSSKQARSLMGPCIVVAARYSFESVPSNISNPTTRSHLQNPQDPLLRLRLRFLNLFKSALLPSFNKMVELEFFMWVQQCDDIFRIVHKNLLSWINILGPGANDVSTERLKTRRIKSEDCGICRRLHYRSCSLITKANGDYRDKYSVSTIKSFEKKKKHFLCSSNIFCLLQKKCLGYWLGEAQKTVLLYKDAKLVESQEAPSGRSTTIGRCTNILGKDGLWISGSSSPSTAVYWWHLLLRLITTVDSHC